MIPLRLIADGINHTSCTARLLEPIISVTLITTNHLFFSMQKCLSLCAVMTFGFRSHQRMDQTAVPINTDMRLHAKVILLAFTGLTHCQSRRKEAIHTHLNASLVALNLLKLEDQQIKKATGATVISIASWKRKKFNQHLMERLFQELGLSLKSQKVAQVYDQMSDYGAIAA